jgi:hypothetical protein
MHTLLLALFCSVLHLGCVTTPIPVPVPPQPQPPVSDFTCADVCQRLDQLGCPAGRPTPMGHTCLEVCRNANDSGTIHWNMECLSTAITCGVADHCQ